MLEKEIEQIIDRNPFFGELLLQVEIKESKEVPTAGVGITKTGIILVYNEDFWNILKDEEKIAILEHELLHLVNKHLLRLGKKNMMKFNIATDLAINQHIDNLPDGGMKIEDFKYPEDLTSEHYYTLLKSDKNFNERMKGMFKKGLIKVNGEASKIGSHKIWNKDNLSDNVKEAILKDAMKRAYKKAKDDIAQKGIGNIPEDMEREIEDFIATKTNWKSLLNSSISTVKSPILINTIKRKNKRFPEMRGFRKEEKRKILIGVDTSGSIDNKSLNLFSEEIKKINMYDNEIWIASCDMVIHQFFKLKPKQKVGPFHGGGGTDFNPIFEKAKKEKPDLIIYFTDGQGVYPEKSSVKTLWALTEDYDIPFGQKIILKDTIMEA